MSFSHITMIKISGKNKAKKEHMFWLMALEGSAYHSRDGMGERHGSDYVSNKWRMGQLH